MGVQDRLQRQEQYQQQEVYLGASSEIWAQHIDTLVLSLYEFDGERTSVLNLALGALPQRLVSFCQPIPLGSLRQAHHLT
ncbi:Uncharacterised protein [Vibrio cholerae]|nr:Uncharacterised protein [Vibrio cholerae]